MDYPKKVAVPHKSLGSPLDGGLRSVCRAEMKPMMLRHDESATSAFSLQRVNVPGPRPGEVRANEPARSRCRGPDVRLGSPAIASYAQHALVELRSAFRKASRAV